MIEFDPPSPVCVSVESVEAGLFPWLWVWPVFRAIFFRRPPKSDELKRLQLYLELGRNERQSGPPPPFLTVIELSEDAGRPMPIDQLDNSYTALEWVYRIAAVNRIKARVAVIRQSRGLG